MISYDSREMFLSKLSHLSRKRRLDKLKFKPKEKVNIYIHTYKEKVKIKDLENREWGAKN